MPRAEIISDQGGEYGLRLRALGGEDPLFMLDAAVRVWPDSADSRIAIVGWQAIPSFNVVRPPVAGVDVPGALPSKDEKQNEVFDFGIAITVPAAHDWIARVERSRRNSPTGEVTLDLNLILWCLQVRPDPKGGPTVHETHRMPVTRRPIKLTREDWSTKRATVGAYASTVLEFPQYPNPLVEGVAAHLKKAADLLQSGSPEGIITAFIECREAWNAGIVAYPGSLGKKNKLGPTDLKAEYERIFDEKVETPHLSKEQRFKLLVHETNVLWNSLRYLIDIGAHPEPSGADSDQVNWDDLGLVYRLSQVLLSYMAMNPNRMDAAAGKSLGSAKAASLAKENRDKGGEVAKNTYHAK